MGFGAVLGAVGSLVAGRAEEESLNLAKRAELVAALEEERVAEVEAGQIVQEGLRLEGGIKTGAAASGITLEGSPMLALLDQAQQVEVARAETIRGGEAAARFRRQRAFQLGKAAETARKVGQIGAATSIIGGVEKLIPVGGGG